MRAWHKNYQGYHIPSVLALCFCVAILAWMIWEENNEISAWVFSGPTENEAIDIYTGITFEGDYDYETQKKLKAHFYYNVQKRGEPFLKQVGEDKRTVTIYPIYIFSRAKTESTGDLALVEFYLNENSEWRIDSVLYTGEADAF